MILQFLILVAGSAGIIYLLKLVFPLLGTGKKSLDSSSRWNADLKPTVGGIAFMIATVTGVCFFIANYPDDLYNILPKYFLWTLAALVAFCIGLWDDISRISVRKKFIGQLLAGVLLVASGSHFHLVETLFSSTEILPLWIDYLLTILIVVALMNSINMMDNMDAAAAMAVLPILGFESQQDPIYFFLLACIVGFIILNWHPSKVFMGDSGSLLLGLLVASALIDHDRFRSGENEFVHLFSLCSVLIADTLLVIWNRKRHGISPFQGGRDHSTHHLSYAGMNQRDIPVLILFISMVGVAIPYFVERCVGSEVYGDWILLRTMPSVAYFVVYFSAILFLSYRNLQQGKFSYTR